MKTAQVSPAQAFAHRLAQLRREKAFLEERDVWPIDVARAVDAGQSSVSRWESGEGIPGDDYLGRLADFYGVTRSWLRYGEGPKRAGESVPAERKRPVIRDEAQDARAERIEPRRSGTAPRKAAGGQKGRQGHG